MTAEEIRKIKREGFDLIRSMTTLQKVDDGYLCFIPTGSLSLRGNVGVFDYGTGFLFLRYRPKADPQITVTSVDDTGFSLWGGTHVEEDVLAMIDDWSGGFPPLHEIHADAEQMGFHVEVW